MIEYSGAAASLTLAVEWICPGGELRLVGVPRGETPDGRVSRTEFQYYEHHRHQGP